MESFPMFFMVEMIGTVAFAFSGAMVAIRKELDLLGIVVLGVTTACGGGMVRDILIGRTPPAMFREPVYVTAAFLAVLALFLVVRIQHGNIGPLASERYEGVVNFFDAVGLGAFTVVGVNVALETGYGDYSFLAVFLGVLTGVGGGLLRDIMAGETPYILKKHVYACASIAGALVYVALLKCAPANAAMLTSALLVVVIRLLARHYRWNLPKAT